MDTSTPSLPKQPRRSPPPTKAEVSTEVREFKAWMTRLDQCRTEIVDGLNQKLDDAIAKLARPSQTRLRSV